MEIVEGWQLLEALDVIVREKRIAAPLERAWEPLTDPQFMPRWYPGANLQPRVGAAATFDCGAAAPYHGIVVEVEPPLRLAWRWCLAAGVPVDEGPTTRVEITLTPAGEATHVRIAESGFAALSPEHRARCQPGNDAGWARLLDSMAEQAGAAVAR